jgi:hypothetical protein
MVTGQYVSGLNMKQIIQFCDRTAWVMKLNNVHVHVETSTVDMMACAQKRYKQCIYVFMHVDA